MWCMHIFQLICDPCPRSKWHPVHSRFSWTEPDPDLPADQCRPGVLDGKPTTLLRPGENDPIIGFAWLRRPLPTGALFSISLIKVMERSSLVPWWQNWFQILVWMRRNGWKRSFRAQYLVHTCIKICLYIHRVGREWTGTCFLLYCLLGHQAVPAFWKS